MISGAHVVVYRKNAEADRSFFRDILSFKSVNAGHGCLIFALPQQKPDFTLLSTALRSRKGDAVPLRRCSFPVGQSDFINQSTQPQ
jgi:hypothetical protein